MAAKSALRYPELVDEIDEILPDHASRRVGDREDELLAKPVGQRRLGGHERFEVIVAAVTPAGADARPFGVARGKLGRTLAPRFAVVGRRPVRVRIGALFRRVSRRLIAVAAPCLAIHRRLVGCWRLVSLGGGRRLVFGAAVEQRIAFEFGFHIGDQIEI